MARCRIQYKDKVMIVGGRNVPPYTLFINEQKVMTAFVRGIPEIRMDKRGMAYIALEILLSNEGKGFWYRGFLYSNGRVAYIDDDKKYTRLRGLYEDVYDAFFKKITTTEFKVAEKRHDVDDDARIFGDLPVMRQPQRSENFVRYKDTRYQIHKLSNGNDSSKDFNENRSTNSCVYWYTLNEYGKGKTDATVSRTKKQDYTEQKPVITGKISSEKKKEIHFEPKLAKYLEQFNQDEYAEVIFREAMVCLLDNFA